MFSSLKTTCVLVFSIIIVLNIGNAYASTVIYKQGDKPGETIGAISLDKCDSKDEKIIHQQKHKNAELQIVCKNYQYQMKIIINGNTYYAGKCPFDGGRNMVSKIISGTPPANGTTNLPDRDILSTTWKSYWVKQVDSGVDEGDVYERDDAVWLYNFTTNELFSYNTTHSEKFYKVNGIWKFDIYDDQKKVKPDGNGGVTPQEKRGSPPDDPQKLGYTLLNTVINPMKTFPINSDYIQEIKNLADNQFPESKLTFYANDDKISMPLGSPLKQFKSGITANHVICKQGLQIMTRNENGYPACVKQDAISRLLELNWGVIPLSGLPTSH